MFRTAISLSLVIAALFLQGCIVIAGSGSSGSNSISVKSIDREYPPRPSNHPIDVYLPWGDELNGRLGSLPNQKLHDAKPRDAIRLIQVEVRQSGEGNFQSLKSLVKDLIKDARDEGGDAIFIEGIMKATILDQTTIKYEFVIARYAE